MPRRSSESASAVEHTDSVASIAQISAPVVADLILVEDFLASIWEESPNPALSQLVRHLLSAGGKKLRPLLALLSASLHAPADARAVRVAGAIEVLHAATLLHDDVIDNAYVRRGQPTANSLWSNALAVLSGDYLFAKCSHVVAELGDPVLVRLLARTVMRMVASETTAFSDIAHVERLEDEYYQKVLGKTASLLELCCESGGFVGGATDAERRTLRKYGENLGTAFQIVDDILDIAGSEEELGKPVGGDLREGTPTLPIIIFLRQQPAHAAVTGLLKQEAGAEGSVLEAVEAIRRSGAIDLAYEKAWHFGEQARSSLAALPAGSCRDSLDMLIDYVIERRQ